MSKSVRYLALLLLSATQVVEMVKNCLIQIHPELGRTNHSEHLLAFDGADFTGAVNGDFVSVYDEDVAAQARMMVNLRKRLDMDHSKFRE